AQPLQRRQVPVQVPPQRCSPPRPIHTRMNVSAPARKAGPRASTALLVAALALATDMFVYSLAVPVLPAVATGQGGSAFGLGVLFGCYAAAFIAVAPVAGRWVDRAGSRQPMLLGLAGLAAATLLFAFAPGFAFLAVARLLQGAAGGIAWTGS